MADKFYRTKASLASHPGSCLVLQLCWSLGQRLRASLPMDSRSLRAHLSTG